MVTRERLIEQSVQEFVKDVLFNERNYPSAQIEVLDSFPYSFFDGEPLKKNYLAAGYDFDDQGIQAEIGSDLTTRNYTIEWFVFGRSKEWGRNLAHAIKFALETNVKVIPLLDVTQAGQPQIDALVVKGVTASRILVPEPEPAHEFVYHTVVTVEDTYSPSLQGWV